MQTKTRTNSVAVTLLAAAITMTYFGAPLLADEKAAPPPQTVQPDKVELFSGKIEAIDLEAKTLLVAKQTYLLVENTKVQNKEKPGKLADLKVGDEIHGQAKKNAAGKLEATIVKLGPKPHEQAPHKAEKPKK